MTFTPRSLKALGNQISVPVQEDEAGYLGRECPEQKCTGYFKIKPGTGLTGQDLPCHCPYCGHVDGHNKFWTPEQIEYAKSVAIRTVADAVFRDLKGLEFNHPPRGPFGIGLRLEVKQGSRHPIHYYREKRLETEVVCESCTLHYAIYGLFGFCPDCRAHNSLQILSKNLDLVIKQLDLSCTIEDAELRRHLTEDALENCVSAFDGFGRETCRIRAQRADGSAHPISFQNPNRFAGRLVESFGIDLRAQIAKLDWVEIHQGFMKRHVIAHRSGIVDAQYIAETSDPTATIGRRIPLEEHEVRNLAQLLRSLGRQLVTLLPPP
jgi:hypothetical protein